MLVETRELQLREVGPPQAPLVGGGSAHHEGGISILTMSELTCIFLPVGIICKIVSSDILSFRIEPV